MMDLNKLSEWEKIGISFFVSIILFRIMFFNESWAVLLKTVSTVYGMFILPGIGITYLFRDLNFVERLAASVAIGAVLVGVPAYYLGLAGVHVKYSAVALPAVFTLLSGAIMLKETRESKKVDNNAP